MLSGTEADILNSVARLRQATKDQIRRDVGFSLDYIGFLCQYLVRRGYLVFSGGHYSLAKEGIKTLLRDEEPKIDKNLIKQIADEVAREISGELKKTVKGLKIPVREIRTTQAKSGEETSEAIKIKTDFEFSVEDQTADLKSNIAKVGIKTEKEKSDIDKSVELFKNIQGRGRKR